MIKGFDGLFLIEKDITFPKEVAWRVVSWNQHACGEVYKIMCKCTRLYQQHY